MSENNNLNKNFMDDFKKAGLFSGHYNDHYAKQVNDYVVEKLDEIKKSNGNENYKLTEADVKSILGKFVELNDTVEEGTFSSPKGKEIGVLFKTIVDNAESIDTCNLIFENEFKRYYTEEHLETVKELIEDIKSGVLVDASNFMDGFIKSQISVFSYAEQLRDWVTIKINNSNAKDFKLTKADVKSILDKLVEIQKDESDAAVGALFKKIVEYADPIEACDMIFKNKYQKNHNDEHSEMVKKLIEDRKNPKPIVPGNDVFKNGLVITNFFLDQKYDEFLLLLQNCFGIEGFKLQEAVKDIFKYGNYEKTFIEPAKKTLGSLDTSAKAQLELSVLGYYRTVNLFNSIIESLGKSSISAQQIEKILGMEKIIDSKLPALALHFKGLESVELNFSSIANIVKSTSKILIFDKIEDNKNLRDVSDKFMQAVLNEFLPGFTPADANKKDFSYTDYVKNFIDDMAEMLESYDKKMLNAGKDGLKISLKLKPEFSFETNLKDHIPDFINHAIKHLADKNRFEDIKGIAKGLLKKILPKTIPELKDLNDFGFVDGIIDSQIGSFKDLKEMLDIFLPLINTKEEDKTNETKNPFGKYSDKLVDTLKKSVYKYISDNVKDGKLEANAINNIKSLLSDGLGLAKEFSKGVSDEKNVVEIVERAKNLYSKASQMFIKDETLESLKSITTEILGDKDIHEYVFSLINPEEKDGVSENDKNNYLKKIFESTVPDISGFIIDHIKDPKTNDPIKEVLDNVEPIVQKAKALSDDFKKTNQDKIGTVVEKAKALYSEVKKLPFIKNNQDAYNKLLVKLVNNGDLHSYVFEMFKPGIEKLAVDPDAKTIDFAKPIFNEITKGMANLLGKYIESVGDGDPIENALGSDILNAVVKFHDEILTDPNKSENTTEVINGLKNLFGVVEEKISSSNKGELKKAYKDLIITVLDQINSENINFVINNFVSEETRSSVTPVTALVGKLAFKQAINNIKANIKKSDMPITELLNDMPDTSKNNVGLVISSINSFNKTFKNKFVRSFVFVAEVIVAVPLAVVIGLEYVFKFIKSKVASKPLDKVKKAQDKQNKNKSHNQKNGDEKGI